MKATFTDMFGNEWVIVEVMGYDGAQVLVLARREPGGFAKMSWRNLSEVTVV